LSSLFFSSIWLHKEEEVVGIRKKLHNWKHYNLYFSSSISGYSYQERWIGQGIKCAC